MKSPVLFAIGVSHRDFDLACLWLRWVTFLGSQEGAEAHTLLIVTTQRITDDQRTALSACVPVASRAWKFVSIQTCPDEQERGYPGSASHLFLRTMEIAEHDFPGHAVCWCEADTVVLRPTWADEITAEYHACGRPFLGVTVGTKYKQMSGIGVYPADWRKRAPKLASVLEAPDFPQWGKGKGCAWDVWARDQTYPQMAESKLMTNIWKSRSAKQTELSEIPSSTCLFHQEKSPKLLFKLAAKNYPEFLNHITIAGPRYFMMNGHESRIRARGFDIKPQIIKFRSGGWLVGFSTKAMTVQDGLCLCVMAGSNGLNEVSEAEYLKISALLTAS